MKSSASESVKNGYLNLERLSRSSRLAQPGMSPLERLCFRRRGEERVTSLRTSAWEAAKKCSRVEVSVAEGRWVEQKGNSEQNYITERSQVRRAYNSAKYP